MDKRQITVTMPIADYEELVDNVEWWQGRFNSLKRIVLKYATMNNKGAYVIDDYVSLANDIETYLNDDDY